MYAGTPQGSVNATPSACSCCAPGAARGKGAPGDVVAVRAQPPGRSRRRHQLAHQSASSAIWMPRPASPARLPISRFMSSISTGHAHDGRAGRDGGRPRRASIRAPARPRSAPAPGRSSAVRHEVLQDHLLDVAVLLVHARERFERFHTLLLGLADPQGSARERDLQLARAAIVSRRRAGCFVGEPACTVSSAAPRRTPASACDAVTSRRRARSARESTPRFVCGKRPRSSARSHTHTTYGEVLVAVLRQFLRT